MTTAPGDPLEPRTEPLGDAPAQSPAPPPGPRRLTRSTGDRVLGGVAGGLGRYFDIDPVVFRIVLAASVLIGGIGIFLYLAALLFVPDDTGRAAPSSRSRLLTVAGASVLTVAALITLGSDGWFYGPVVPLLLLGGFGYVIYGAIRNGTGDGGPVTPGRLVAWFALGIGGTLVLGALVVGSAWAAAEGSGALVAAVVIALGVAMVALSLRPGHGARWLVLPALAIAAPLGIVAAADISLDGGYGERLHEPVALSEVPASGYRIGAGALELDLRRLDLPADGTTAIDVGVGVGYALVRVPENVCVHSTSRLGAGAIGVGDRWTGGLDLEDAAPRSPGGEAGLLIRGDVGMGAIEVLAGDDEPDESRALGDRRRDTDDDRTEVLADPTAACGTRAG